ncbi:hypothetical protein M501DRAFT_920906, partial [Patellaria atrata CBS 101060]
SISSPPPEETLQLSPSATDRVFPIRSVISVNPTPTPSMPHRRDHSEGYFYRPTRHSYGSDTSQGRASAKGSVGAQSQGRGKGDAPKKPSPTLRPNAPRLPAQVFSDIASSKSATESGDQPGDAPPSVGDASSVKSTFSTGDDAGGLYTARFKHVITDGGHMVITGRDGDSLQRCEDEPIHIPGAVQGFGLLIALKEESDGKLVVRIASENAKRIIGYTPKQLFALDSFTDILSEEQADNLLDHVDFIREDENDVQANGPEIFTMSIRPPNRRTQKLWCAMHTNDNNPDLVICEFELEDDPLNPLVPSAENSPEVPEDTLSSNPTQEELAESTENLSRPLRILRSARRRKGEAAAMEVFNIMSQVQEQLGSAPSLEKFLKILVGVVKELTGFHRVMIYQFDQSFNGKVVTELVDPRATKDLFKGLNFPASDIPKQARELYKINKVRLLYDRDQETARLVCRTAEDLETPLDLTHAYLRAMSPIHLKYLANMHVRSSMSISVNAFNELWGLIACHSYGPKGRRVSFPIRKMCRLVGDSASRNIERLSYASRLQARKLINTVPTEANPSGYIIASSEDLLKLFNADFGLLSIRDETKILGHIEQSQEALAMLEYLRMRKLTSVVNSHDIAGDFPDLKYPPGFKEIAGMLFVPLSVGGLDFIVFFRKGQLKKVKWAGNPYEKFIREGTESYLEPRKSFKTWSEIVVGKSREWTEEEIETAAVLCLVYGKFIEVWRQKEAVIQSTELTRLLLANSAHEVRTPLNAIINYLEIALEGSLDMETRENLAKSHSASKSLIYVINDLLDLTKTEEGGELVKGEVFDLRATLKEATDMFVQDAKRKGIEYSVKEHEGLPQSVIGDQRKVRQAISNIVANAIQHTLTGSVAVEMYCVSWNDRHVEVELAVQDTGKGMNTRQTDSLFRDLEQVQSEANLLDRSAPKPLPEKGKEAGARTLGLGLAVVARIVRNMNGQLRLKSEEGKGSRFIIQFPFDLPEGEEDREGETSVPSSSHASIAPQPPEAEGEVTLIARDEERSTPSKLTRRESGDSLESRNSLRSNKSSAAASAHSAKSDLNRLIGAMQETYGSEVNLHPSPRSSWSAKSHKPRLERRLSHGAGLHSSPIRTRARSVGNASADQPPYERSTKPMTPGLVEINSQGVPLTAVKMPDDGYFERKKPLATSSSVLGEVEERADHMIEATSFEHMHVLVAEDDPVNSRIMRKRLEKAGHEPYVTSNGEECATIYAEKSGLFDVVLMDIQMPIVDGLTSTRMIRTLETSTPPPRLSTRASLNGRVPIIAVSATLVEKDRQMYIDAGFDGWILKPVSFPRLAELMRGIVDKGMREESVYSGGDWEKGGWFHRGKKSGSDVDTGLVGGIP